MGEIIKIEIDSIVIGMDDGSVVRVNLSDVNFIPQVGDKVKVFKDNDGYLVSKVTEEKIVENKNFVEKENTSDNLKRDTLDGRGKVTNNYYINTSVQNKKKVNKLAYVLLAFFLGGIGGHKFYSGKIGTGIVYLIFSWTFIPSMIAFVEFIIALTKPSDEYGEIYV
ncbi:MAG: TM2 domain-containing protein [Pseudomonas aeruginosa]|nr:TM2 domain-containing protein [Pseudomonas aeruginosa]